MKSKKKVQIPHPKKKEEKKKISQNTKALLIGLIGAAFTLFAYSQTFISPSQSITIGLLILMLGLLVGEGLIPL